MNLIIACTLVPLALGSPGPATRLRVEYMEQPLGIDIAKPRFTWALQHTSRGQQQTAYELTVKMGDKATWTTGKVASNTTQNVAYDGPALQPDTKYTWTTKWWDAEGTASPEAQSFFTTGLFEAKDWQGATWIGAPPTISTGVHLRREFKVNGPVKRATAYVVGLGYYKLSLDGERVSTHELGPFTTFAERVYYDTHDVTAALSTADSSHAIGVTLGDGWYAQASVKAGKPSLYFLLSIELADGSKQYVTSSTGWKAKQGPVVSCDIYAGETYDARLETSGWDVPGFDETSWASAVTADLPSDHVKVTSHAVLPPIRVTQTFSACDLWESSPGVFVFDFCQNMAGFTTLRVPEGVAMTANTSILQAHAEALHGPKPSSIFHHYGNTKEIATYTTRGDGAAIEYSAQFVYYAFRYVQLTGYPGTPSRETLTAHFIHTDYDLVGSIAFSDPMLTAVQRITRAAAMSNFQSIPTDCPQRERRGWLGDAQLSAETNIYNFDMAGPYTSFVQQIKDEQDKSTGQIGDCVPFYHHGQTDSDPAWGGAFVLLADWVGEYYADNEIFGRHYSGITAYVDHLTSLASSEGMDGLLAYGGWGDWCPPQGCHACWNRKEKGDSMNSVVVSSFYYLTELRVLARYAGFLGKQADAKKYGDLAESVAAAFVKHFYDKDRKTFVENNRTCSEQLSPQTLIALGVTLGLVPKGDEEAVAKNLVEDIAANDWHLNVGIVGVKYLLPTLSKLGRTDVALMIAQQRTPPSYIYMVEQGATTLWETWKGTMYQPVASWNHIMFGSNSEWYYKYLAGLNLAPGSRGWQHIEFYPRVFAAAAGQSICSNLSSAEASVATPRGLAAAAWSCGTSSTCGMTQENSNLDLSCPGGALIKKVSFASFGTPEGECPSFKHGSCHSNTSQAVVEKACLGKSSCSVPSNNKLFGGDPCFGTPKRLAAQIQCDGSLKDFSFSYKVTAPVGSTGSVVLPTMGMSTISIVESGSPVWKSGQYVPGVRGVSGASQGPEGVRVAIGSGSFDFTISGHSSSLEFV